MNQKSLYNKLPLTPGVYLMKDKTGTLLYVGKAANLRRRVTSYFTRPHDNRIQNLVERIHRIDYRKTDTAIEALILEAQLIKQHEPPFNVREKDDKSFLYVGISKDHFPRVLLIRGKEIDHGHAWKKVFGPFTSASNIREALRIIRRIFPYTTHATDKQFARPCFDYQIRLCPGVCVGKISRSDYAETIRNLILFFEGEKKKVIRNLKQRMALVSRNLEFEEAEKLRRQLFALEHIQDVALITEPELFSGGAEGFRIEGYDISNISGTQAVGSMVVFEDGKPAKGEYRKFRIKTVRGANDVGMMREVLERRFKKIPPAGGWALPQLILVDGGQAQVNVARRVVNRFGLHIPVVGLAKGPLRKRNDLVGRVPDKVLVKTLIAVRDEAHRFAIGYHKKVREREFLPK